MSWIMGPHSNFRCYQKAKFQACHVNLNETKYLVTKQHLLSVDNLFYVCRQYRQIMILADRVIRLLREKKQEKPWC